MIMGGIKGGKDNINSKPPPRGEWGVPLGGGQNELKNNIKKYYLHFFLQKNIFFSKFFPKLFFYKNLFLNFIFYSHKNRIL